MDRQMLNELAAFGRAERDGGGVMVEAHDGGWRWRAWHGNASTEGWEPSRDDAEVEALVAWGRRQTPVREPAVVVTRSDTAALGG